MKLIITSEGKLHLQSVNNPDTQEVSNRQELALSLQFADTALIDEDTDEVELKLKLSHASSGLAASVTLARVGATAVYSAYINLSTSVLNAITGTAAVWMECTWLLGGKLQRSDPRQVTIRQSLTTGEEGAPEADQTLADRAAWLEDSLVAGDNITLEFDPLTGRVTITGAAGASEVAWADITGKPSTFPPEAHSQAISTITGLQAELDGKAATSHTQAISTIIGLQTELDGKATASHTQAISTITGLQTALDAKAESSALAGKLDLAGGTVTGQLILNQTNANGALRITPNWSVAGTTYAAGVVDVTHSNSHANSALLSLRLNTSALFDFRRTDSYWGQPAIWTSGSGFNFQNSSGGVSFQIGGSSAIIAGTGRALQLTTTESTVWIGTLAAANNFRVGLSVPANDILEVKNGTTANTFRLFGTSTNTTNYRRLNITSTTAGVFAINASGEGTGASGNVIHISSLPTSNPGPGILWNNAGTPAIGT